FQILSDMGTYLNKAIPDTKLTIRKYADTKFEYLSYCLKVKEMDDEEYGYNALQEPLYRVETGNYEYRLILRCRQDARTRFARLRSDVLVKLELLENKKTQDVAYQLRRFIQGLAVYHNESVEHLKDNATLFPVEVDLSQNAFQYKSTAQIIQDGQEEDEELEFGKEIHEYHDIADIDKEPKLVNRRQTKDNDDTESSEQLLPDFDNVTLNYDKVDKSDNMDNLTLLTELGLADTNVQDDFGDFQNGLLDEFMPKTSGEDKNDIFEDLLSDFSNLNK
ncbi:PRKCA-binding protein-like, partial [Helicoverpa zea]|uniref:PRKCA-binding protein-like n=1 Tax=Helicoverpa zea TaxID=7113 RepID=UPI001F589A00